MRNLKKILALVLSLMMVLSVMVTASATDFADDADITNKEAVEVMSALGILSGSQGKFAPQGTLERAQAAKIIAFLKLGADADALLKGTGSTVFEDVTSGWAYDYVSYCAGEGIVSGSQGKFFPKNTLTGYEFGKMVLNAAGVEGTYTGSGQGFKSTITVAVTISDGKIIAIEIVSAGDDEPYFSNAKGLINSVIAAQSTSVDTISGATYSSKGILVAIKNALEKAAGGTGSDTGASSAPASAASGKSHATLNPTQVPTSGYADGTYCGEGEGYKSTIRVAVTIAGGKISKIDILSQGDDAAYFNRAKSLIATVVDKQTTAVDTVSGATFSSEGILAAVEDALRQAAVKTGNGTAADKPAGDSGNTGSGNSPSKPDGDDKPSQSEPTETRYLDGDYTVYVKCENTEDPDAFEPYYLAMTVTVENGKASAIKDVHGTNKATHEDAVLEEYDESNDAYLEWAAFGRVVRGKEYVGVVKQLIDLHASPSNVDVVSRSTYSSKAIVKAYEKALELANEAYKKANPSDDAATGDAGGPDAASGKGETGSTSNSRGEADRA